MSENRYNPQYDDNKKTDKIYVSKMMNWKPFKGRYVEQFLESPTNYFVVTEKDSQILYETEGGRQKIQATLLETGTVPVIYVSKINVKTGTVNSSGTQQMCLIPEVAEKLYNFIGKVKSISNTNHNNFKIEESDFSKLDSNVVNKTDSYLYFKNKPTEITELIANLINDKELAINDISKLLDTKKKENVLQELRLLMDNKSKEKEFEKLLEKNLWIFGNEFSIFIDDKSINTKNSLDIIPKSYDGFIDIIELKTPEEELFAYDESHKNYYPKAELTKTIAQMQNYLFELEKKTNEKDYQVSNTCQIVKPKGIIVYGSKNDLSGEELKYLRILNSSYHNITIFTYQQILNRAENLLKKLTTDDNC